MNVSFNAPGRCGVRAGSAFESTARRRDAKARAAEAEGSLVTARDNPFMAAIHYGVAEWPYDVSSKKHLALHDKKKTAL